MLAFNEVHHGDCLEVMQQIDDTSIDMILADLPYGTTACEWDQLIDLDTLWKHYHRIIKPNGVIVLTAIQPFTSQLVMSNLKDFKYSMYWQKEKPTNFFQLKRRPGKTIEEILVFYKNQPTYHPQMRVHTGKLVSNKAKSGHGSIITGKSKVITSYKDTGYRYPSDLITINRDKIGTAVHPTQKPVALFEYLIKTYTNENDLVLDNVAGSGTTGVACKRLNRNFILIEKNIEYCQIASDRLTEILI